MTGAVMASEERSSGKEVFNKASWTPNVHETFIDLCLEQISQGNKSGARFNKLAWRNIQVSFYNRTGLRYDKKQFKNHLDNTKKVWRTWQKLVTTQNMKWDPETNRFGATDEEWNDYIERNPDAAQFRLKELHLLDKLNIVFDGIPLQETKSHIRSRKYNVNLTVDHEAVKLLTPRRKYNAGLIADTEETGPPFQRRKHNDGLTHSFLNVKEPASRRPDSRIEQLVDAGESRSVVTVQSPPTKLNYGIGDCIECLDSMEQVEQGSDLYLFALDIFLKKEYREIFLNLKKPSVRIAWLERLQSSGQSLPSNQDACGVGFLTDL